MFLKKGVLEICVLQSNFIEIALSHGCSPVNLLHIFRTPFPKITSGGLLLNIVLKSIVRFVIYFAFHFLEQTLQRRNVITESDGCTILIVN